MLSLVLLLVFALIIYSDSSAEKLDVITKKLFEASDRLHVK